MAEKNIPENEEFMDYDTDIVSLVDEDGVEREFELVDTLDLDDGTSYVALLTTPGDDPAAYLQSDGRLIIMKYVKDENGEDALMEIAEDDEYDDIATIFMNRLSDLYDFDDEDEEEDDED